MSNDGDHTMTSMDEEGLSVCERLSKAFEIESRAGEIDVMPCRYSLGMEIEVPWSSYFPDLWVKYGLQDRRIGALSPLELVGLTKDCSEQEKTLLPQLSKTVAAGIPRGNDRYWEFAFNPVHDEQILTEQVRLLTHAGMLPRDRRHSLQITVGGIKSSAALYRLAMVMEIMFVEPQRIVSGIEQTLSTIHTGWARKGMAGIHLKKGDELQGGCEEACEIRPLQLPQTDKEVAKMMEILRWGLDSIAAVQLHADSAAGLQGRAFQAMCSDLLKSHGLPDRNWARSVDGLNLEIQHSTWTRFAQAMPAMKHELTPLIEGFLSDRQILPAVANSEKIVTHRFMKP